MLTTERLRKMLEDPYPRLTERRGHHLLLMDEDILVPITPPRYPLALALQYRYLNKVQKRALLLALFRERKGNIEPYELMELEQLLDAPHATS